jgi:uncharacterized protein YutD
MKKKVINDNEVVTRSILREELRKELQKELQNYPTRQDLQNALQDALKEYPTREEFRIYRDEILNKLDYIVGELQQAREDRIFIGHDITNLKETDTDHEKRLKILEAK